MIKSNNNRKNPDNKQNLIFWQSPTFIRDDARAP